MATMEFSQQEQDMWLGLLHHAVGEHEWHDGQCSHGPLTSSESDKPLLRKGSKAMEALRRVIYDKRWLESLIFYVWFKHTSFLENFNSMMLKYAPKRNSFDFLAFCLRLFLAALDHNIHIFRPQATTKDGQPLWKKQYSKRTKRGHPEPVKEEKSFEYIPFLMASILKGRADDEESAGRVVICFNYCNLISLFSCIVCMWYEVKYLFEAIDCISQQQF